MIAGAIAMVKAGSDDESVEIGTAFPVGECFVITARHVIWNDATDSLHSDIEVSWVHREGEAFSIAHTATKVELGHDLGTQHDLVVLKCEVPAKYQNYFFLSIRPPQREQRWETFGYAEVYADRDELKQTPANGTFGPLDDRSSQLLLDYERGPSDHRRWGGMSGAPICCGQSVLAAAVEVEDPDRRDRTFHASSMAWLLDNDEKFRGLVLPPLDVEIVDRAEQILDGSGDARSRLQQAARDQGLRFDSRRECIEKLIRMPVAELVRMVRDVQEGIRKRSGSGATMLGKFLAALLPLTLEDVEVQRIRSGKRQGVIGVVRMSRHATTISAEMLMARADLRAACFRLKHSDAGNESSQPRVDPSMYALELPPEAGDDRNKYTASAATDLYQRFGGDVGASRDGVARHLYRSLVPPIGREYEDPEKIIRLVNDHLRDLVMDGEPVYYWVLDDRAERESSRPRPEWLHEISSTFPSLALVVLAGDFDCDQRERSDYRFLGKVEGLAES